MRIGTSYVDELPRYQPPAASYRLASLLGLRAMTPAFRSGLAITAAWLIGIGSFGNVTRAQGAGDLEVLQLRPNFFMIAGAGGHIGVQIGDDGVVVVDAGSAARADAVVAAVK